MNVNTVKQIVNRGIKSLVKSMEQYWPAIKKNDMSERNITSHVCHSFLQSNWFMYAEVSFPKQAGQRLDMLALSSRNRGMVAIESKRLESAAKAKELAKDARRMKKFRLTKDNASFVPHERNRFGLLLAFTWSPEIQEWWKAKTHASRPHGARGAGWKALGRRLDGYKAVCRFVKVPEYGETEGKYKDFWALYAIYKLKRNK